MSKQTRALLLCGLAGGPMYVTVTLIEALTRDGFDLRQHRFSWLTTGDLGWIHQLAMAADREDRIAGPIVLLLDAREHSGGQHGIGGQVRVQGRDPHVGLEE